MLGETYDCENCEFKGICQNYKQEQQGLSALLFHVCQKCDYVSAEAEVDPENSICPMCGHRELIIYQVINNLGLDIGTLKSVVGDAHKKAENRIQTRTISDKAVADLTEHKLPTDFSCRIAWKYGYEYAKKEDK